MDKKYGGLSAWLAAASIVAPVAGESRRNTVRKAGFSSLRSMPRSRVLLCSTALAILTAPAQAQQIIDGQTINVPGDQTSPWNIGSTLYVGQSGAGTLRASGVISESGFC